LTQLGPLEQRLLEAVWLRGNVTVRELIAGGELKIAYTTVMTTLDRLYKKGFLGREKLGRAFVYSPAVSHQQFAAMVAQQAAETVLTFAELHTADVLSHFVDTLGDSDSQMLLELEKLIKARREAETR